MPKHPRRFARRLPSALLLSLLGIVACDASPWLTAGINQPDGTRTLDQYFDHFPAR